MIEVRKILEQRIRHGVIPHPALTLALKRLFTPIRWGVARGACGFWRHVDKRRMPLKNSFAHKTWTAARKEYRWGTPDHRLHKHTDKTY